MLLALFALVSDATLERVELTLQSSIEPLVVRTLPHEHEHQYHDDDDHYPAANTYNDRPPAGHRCASIRSRRVNVLQVTEIKKQVADTHLYTMTSRQIEQARMSFLSEYERYDYDHYLIHHNYKWCQLLIVCCKFGIVCWTMSSHFVDGAIAEGHSVRPSSCLLHWWATPKRF